MVLYVQPEKDTFAVLSALRQQIENMCSIFVKGISISNFRCFSDANNENNAFKISFNIPKNNKPGSGLTILIGENNSGKSTVLRAIKLFSLDDKDLDDMLAKHELNASYVDDPSKGAEIHLHTDSGEFYLKTINSDKELQWECDGKILKEKFRCCKISNLLEGDLLLNAFHDNNGVIDHLMCGSSSFPPNNPRAEKIFASKIRQGNRRDGEDYPVEKTSCGRSIPAWQLGSGDRQFRHITNSIKDNDEASAKTDTCRLFLLDEPETHLHPKAVQALVDMLWEASANVQIILASHSPVLIEAVYNKAKGAYDEAEKNQW